MARVWIVLLLAVTAAAIALIVRPRSDASPWLPMRLGDPHGFGNRLFDWKLEKFERGVNRR